MMDDIFVTNIQRFSLHDGPGIRTTVFLKGCSLRCPWCCNPENISPRIQPYRKDGVPGTYGVRYSADALYQEVTRDKAFYSGQLREYQIEAPPLLEKLPGGVTFSGGEALLQIGKLETLLRRLKDEHIHTAIETCLFAPKEALNTALSYIDLFYVDIKILEEQRCAEQLHGDLSQYLENIRTLMESGRPVVFRVPVIGGYTEDEENRRRVLQLLKTVRGNVLKVELIKEHDLGRQKYMSLISGGNDILPPRYAGVSEEQIEAYRAAIAGAVEFPVEICRI